MEALSSVFGNQPGTIDKPVPGQEREENLVDQVRKMNIPQTEDRALVPPNEPQAAAPAASEEADPLFAGVADDDPLFAGVDLDEGAPAPAPSQAASEGVALLPGDDSVPTETLSQRMERGESLPKAVANILDHSFTRAKASFAVGDSELEKYLKKTYGEKNVRVRGDRIQYKLAGEKNFTDFDPEGADGPVEAMNDYLDFVREGVEGAIEMTGRIGGGIAGFGGGAVAGAGAGLATGPLAPIASPAGAATGGALGGIAGQAIGGAVGAIVATNMTDAIAEGLIGIERDPNRSRMQETGAAGFAGLVFGGIASYLGRRAAKKAAAGGTTTPKAVLEEAELLKQDVDALKQSGINLEIGPNGMALSPGQIARKLSPEATDFDKAVTIDGRARDFFIEQAKAVGSSWDSLLAVVTNVTGKSPANLLSRARAAGQLAKEIEGATIRSYRDMAMQLTKNTTRDLPKSAPALGENLKKLGFEVTRVMDDHTQQVRWKINAPTGERNTLASRFRGAKPELLSEYESLIQKYGEKMLNGSKPKVKTSLKAFLEENPHLKGKPQALDAFKESVAKHQAAINQPGRMGMKDVDMFYTDMRNFIDRNIDNPDSRKLAESLIEMKNNLRDDWTGVIETELKTYGYDKVDIDGYKIAMGKFHDIVGAQDVLKGIMKSHDLSSAAFSDKIFSSGLGKDRVRQLKTLIQETDPELWPQLVDHRLRMLTENAVSISKKGGREMSWTKLNKGFEKLKKGEMLDEMLPKEAQQTMERFLRVAERVDAAPAFKLDQAKGKGAIGVVRNLLIATMAHVSTVARVGAGRDLVGDTLVRLGKDGAVLKWLEGEGLELVLKGMPTKKASDMRIFVNKLASQGRRTSSRVGAQSVLRDTQEFSEEARRQQ